MKSTPHCQNLQDVVQTRQGDDSAFTRLVERYQAPVYNLCCQMLGDPDMADDAAQESFLRAYRKLAGFDIQRSFASWLLAIAAHYCIDTLRRRKYQQVSIDQTSPDDEREIELVDTHAVNPEDELIKAEGFQTLHQVMGELNATDRAAIVLRYWNEFSEAEISEMLEISVSAVKSRLFRARREITTGLTRKPEQLIPAAPFPLAQSCGKKSARSNQARRGSA